MTRSSGALALLCVVTVLAMAPGLDSPFQLDDRGVITQDPRVHDLGTAIGSLGSGLRPVLRLSYAVSWWMGPGPVSFHVANLVTHLIAVMLVRALTLRATHRPDAALLAAALFALHPLATEAVVYASGRSSSLAAVFALAAVLVWVDGIRAGSVWRSQGLAAGLTILAALTKETTVATLGAVALWDHLVFATPLRAMPRRMWGIAIATAALMLGAVLHDAVYGLLLGVVGAETAPVALARQAEGMAYLASRLVWVHRLCIDPGLGFRPPDPAALGAGILVTLAAGAAAWRSHTPAVALGLAWWLLHLWVPYAGLPRIDGLNERHAYLPDAGLAMALGAALADPVARSARARAGLMVALILLALATARRAADYRSEVSLWTATVSVAPDNPRAHRNLGAALESTGQLADARAAYQRALALEPAYASARDGLERIDARQRRNGSAAR